MARDLKVGETVYIPRSRLNLPQDGPDAFYRTRVQEVDGRSIRVALAGGDWSQPVATSAVHRSIGVMLLRIGDFQTEATLLDPLAKSILQYLRLLLTDDYVILRSVRSVAEMVKYWTQDHGAFSHVIIVGHGRRDGIQFGVDGWQSAAQLSASLTVPGVTPKHFISLCCQTGYAAFAQSFSRQPVCQTVAAPFHSVHGAVASQFCQTLLAYHLLEGETMGVAFRHARTSVPGSVSFRIWENGSLTAGAR